MDILLNCIAGIAAFFGVFVRLNPRFRERRKKAKNDLDDPMMGVF